MKEGVRVGGRELVMEGWSEGVKKRGREGAGREGGFNKKMTWKSSVIYFM